MIDGWGISCEIALIWISHDLNDEKSTFIQVMAWCRQATSHYLNQCWHRSLSPYGVTRPQWVKEYKPFISSAAGWFNTFAPGKSGSCYRSGIFEHTLPIKFRNTSCEIAFKWMPQNTFNDKSTLVQLMAWCRLATSHYMSQCWHGFISRLFISTNCVTGPHWAINTLIERCFAIWPHLTTVS